MLVAPLVAALVAALVVALVAALVVAQSAALATSPTAAPFIAMSTALSIVTCMWDRRLTRPFSEWLRRLVFPDIHSRRPSRQIVYSFIGSSGPHTDAERN